MVPRKQIPRKVKNHNRDGENVLEKGEARHCRNYLKDLDLATITSLCRLQVGPTRGKGRAPVFKVRRGERTRTSLEFCSSKGPEHYLGRI